MRVWVVCPRPSICPSSWSVTGPIAPRDMQLDRSSMRRLGRCVTPAAHWLALAMPEAFVAVMSQSPSAISMRRTPWRSTFHSLTARRIEARSYSVNPESIDSLISSARADALKASRQTRPVPKLLRVMGKSCFPVAVLPPETPGLPLKLLPLCWAPAPGSCPVSHRISRQH